MDNKIKKQIQKAQTQADAKKIIDKLDKTSAVKLFEALELVKSVFGLTAHDDFYRMLLKYKN